MNGANRSFQPPKGTIAYHTHPTAFWKYITFHTEIPYLDFAHIAETFYLDIHVADAFCMPEWTRRDLVRHP